MAAPLSKSKTKEGGNSININEYTSARIIPASYEMTNN